MRKPYHYSVTRHVRATSQTVWDVISDHAGMTQWTPFRRAVLERPGRPHPNGVGAVRALHLIGPPTREEVLDFDPPHRLRYRLLSGLPFRDYVGEITVEPDGTGTRLSTCLQFQTCIPGTQAFGPIAIRLATRAAAHLAEKRARSQALAAPVLAHRPSPAPTGWRRALFRMPILAYRLNLGWVLGDRLLLLNHIGRTTGKPRQTILEVLDHNGHDSYVVASGWGPKAQWYQNIQAAPAVSIQVGTRTLPVEAESISEEAGAEIFARYASLHRIAARYIWPPMLGHSVDGQGASVRAFGRRIAFVRFVPRARS